MNETQRQPERRDLVGPLLVRLKEYDGPSCTACGASMTAVAFVTTKGADAVLCCDKCGRRGVFCVCPCEPGHVGLGSR